jgi:hypothetical protein
MQISDLDYHVVESSWNVMAHGDERVGKRRGNWRMEWVASTLRTASEHGVSSITTITTADAQTSAISSRLNWLPRRFEWTRPFRRKTKSGFCVCAFRFQTQSDNTNTILNSALWPEWWGNFEETSGRLGAVRRQDCCARLWDMRSYPLAEQNTFPVCVSMFHPPQIRYPYSAFTSVACAAVPHCHLRQQKATSTLVAAAISLPTSANPLTHIPSVWGHTD